MTDAIRGGTEVSAPRLASRHYVLLAAIILVGLVARVGYLWLAVRSPGYVWVDPDAYIMHALRLVTHDAWHWTFDAVTVAIDGRRHALPPGYYVFLSLFALFPGFPLNAQIAQTLLGTLSVALVFLLGRQVHSIAAGLLASAAYALWLPPILNVWNTAQETVYVPLVLVAFLALGRAVARDGAPVTFGVAGIAFGVAALTRSMPLFFIGPAALVHVALSTDRRRAGFQALMLLAGVAVLTVPYSVALSRHFGRVAIIDTHGSIHLDVAPGQDAPGIGESARAIIDAMREDPGTFLTGIADRARTLLYVNGGRLLQLYVVAESKWQARVLKLLVHFTADLLLIVTVVLAPLGVVVCRERRIAVLWLLWAGINIAVAALGGFGGARLRAPFEPFMIIMAAVVLVGHWRVVSRWELVPAVTLGAAAALAVVPQIPRSLAARVDYGVTWTSPGRSTGRVTSDAGFTLPVRRGIAEFTAVPSLRGEVVNLKVRAQGRVVWMAQIEGAAPTSIRVPWQGAGLAYVEVTARTAGGSPSAFAIGVDR